MQVSETIRAFIAVTIDEEVRDRIRELMVKLKRIDSGVKWVRPESMHLTLRFLGNITPDQVELADQAMAGAASGFEPVRIEVKGFGTFPPEKRPRVVWLGLGKGGTELGRVFEHLEAGLLENGLGPADKPFSPHLTLGRVKSGRGMGRVMRVLESEAKRSFGKYLAESVFLIRSELHPGGARYTVLRERPFQGQALQPGE